jgi:hypothetical protein
MSNRILLCLLLIDEDTILDKQKQSKEPTGNSNE